MWGESAVQPNEWPTYLVMKYSSVAALCRISASNVHLPVEDAFLSESSIVLHV
jgi:hypothetical protein